MQRYPTRDYKQRVELLLPCVAYNHEISDLIVGMSMWTLEQVSEILRCRTWNFLRKSIYFWERDDPETLMDKFYKASDAKYTVWRHYHEPKRAKGCLPPRARAFYYNFLVAKMNKGKWQTKTELGPFLDDYFPKVLHPILFDYLLILLS